MLGKHCTQRPVHKVTSRITVKSSFILIIWVSGWDHVNDEQKMWVNNWGLQHCSSGVSDSVCLKVALGNYEV